MLPLVRHAAARFAELRPTITVEVIAGGSQLGLEQVEQGVIDIGDLDLPIPRDPVATLLHDQPIAATIFAVVSAAGPHLPPDRQLTSAQIAQIFSGELVDWQQVGGAAGPIFVIDRPRSSGTRAVFVRQFFGGEDRLARRVPIADSSGTVARTLAALPGSISYVPVPYVRAPLVALAIDGVLPGKEAVTDGRYRFWARGRMVTRRNATRAARAFVDFVRSPEFQDREIERLGYLPIAAVGEAP